jgi:hypothetical protein
MDNLYDWGKTAGRVVIITYDAFANRIFPPFYSYIPHIQKFGRKNLTTPICISDVIFDLIITLIKHIFVPDQKIRFSRQRLNIRWCCHPNTESDDTHCEENDRQTPKTASRYCLEFVATTHDCDNLENDNDQIYEGNNDSVFQFL